MQLVKNGFEIINNKEKHVPSIKAPHSNTREVNIMGIFGLQMKVLKDVLQEKRNYSGLKLYHRSVLTE